MVNPPLNSTNNSRFDKNRVLAAPQVVTSSSRLLLFKLLGAVTIGASYTLPVDRARSNRPDAPIAIRRNVVAAEPSNRSPRATASPAGLEALFSINWFQSSAGNTSPMDLSAIAT